MQNAFTAPAPFPLSEGDAAFPGFSERKDDCNQQKNGERDAKQIHRSGLILQHSLA